MADLEITQGDTYPPLKGFAFDEDGAVDLAEADELEAVLRKTGSPLVRVTLPAEAISETDGDQTWNWQADWEADSTEEPGTYTAKLKVTWNSTTTPPLVEWFPNGPGLEVVIGEAP